MAVKADDGLMRGDGKTAHGQSGAERYEEPEISRGRTRCGEDAIITISGTRVGQ